VIAGAHVLELHLFGIFVSVETRQIARCAFRALAFGDVAQHVDLALERRSALEICEAQQRYRDRLATPVQDHRFPGSVGRP
jgi:hypothetical protein